MVRLTPSPEARLGLGRRSAPGHPYLETAQLFPTLAEVGAFTVPLALELLVHAGRGLQDRARGRRRPRVRGAHPDIQRSSRHLP